MIADAVIPCSPRARRFGPYRGLCVAGLLLLLVPSGGLAQRSADTTAGARHTIEAVFESKLCWWGYGRYCSGVVRAQVTSEGIEFTHKGVRSEWRFKDLPYFDLRHTFRYPKWHLRPASSNWRATDFPYKKIGFDETEAAHEFVEAWNHMIWENSVEKARLLEQFQQKIRTWRANGSKVELPEEALRHKVLAEEAFQEKDFPKAADEYEAGLHIYPTWPEGQFACAAIEGELKDYDDAIAHMKVYLELVPNAPNAEKAKEQIWIWQDKENRGTN